MELLIDSSESFCKEVARKSGQPVEACFQCQKCSSGCPVAGHADYTPAQVIRLVQYGLKEQLLSSRFLWLCPGCETCGARCPNGINTARVLDVLKNIAFKEKVARGPEPLFHQRFLASIRAHGRAHEAGVLFQYKLKSGQVFSDLGLGFTLLKKGKLHLLPSRIKKRDEMDKIFGELGKRSIFPSR